MHRAIALIFILLSIFGFSTHAAAEKRVALVVGNVGYQHAPKLINPMNDAIDVEASLKRLGFNVVRVMNTNFDALRLALRDFTRQARGAEIAIIFYAGHGMEIGGQNWLIPVDAELQYDTDAETQTINLKTLMLAVSNTTSLGLVILDACRNNPFVAGMQRMSPTRTFSAGLARVEPAENVLVAYAAKDGTTAADGLGRNSPFSKALLQHLETAGLEIMQLFRHVRDDVMAATQGKQQPFVYGSLSKKLIYFRAPPAGDTPRAEDQVKWRMLKEAVASAEFDDLVSPQVKRAAEARAIEQFLREFPNGRNATEARSRLQELTRLLAIDPPGGTTAEDEIAWRYLQGVASGKELAELSSAKRVEAEILGIEEFLKKFPRSRHSGDAQKRLAELRTFLAKNPSPDSAEELAWRTLGELAAGTVLRNMSQQQRLVVEASGIEEFLQRFPRSRHGDAARARLKQLEKIISEKLVAPSGQRDEPTATEDRRFIDGLRTRAARALTQLERKRLAEIIRQRSTLDLEIPFDYNSVEIGPQAAPVLQALGRVLLKEEFKGTVFLISGHTDAKGDADYNQDLSERRAEAVKALLIKQFNLPTTVLITVGYGRTQLKNTADPFAGENRRVQIVNTEVK